MHCTAIKVVHVSAVYYINYQDSNFYTIILFSIFNVSY